MNQLSQPGVIDMAAEIARLNTPVPETRHYDEQRHQQAGAPAFAHKFARGWHDNQAGA
jgi:hypothetical protein